MMLAIECPHCHKTLETDQAFGQVIACPYCEVSLTIRPEFRVRHPGRKNPLIEIAIPAGYVLFVAVPMALTFWFFMHQDEEHEQETPQIRKPVEVIAAADREVKKNPAVLIVPKPQRKAPPPNPQATPEREFAVTPKEVQTPKEISEPAKTEEIAIAPPPTAIPDTEVAPAPRELFWKPPLSNYSSAWQKVGAVNIRVAGVVPTKVAFADTEGRVSESAEPLLVVTIEASLNTPSKSRRFRPWSQSANRSVIFLEGGKELPAGRVPVGKKLHSPPFVHQFLPPDGTVVRDYLLFATPPQETREMELRLEAERCGEPGDIWFKIPSVAWRK